MERVRCTCGVLLSSPPGRLTVRCPRCYATIVCPQTRQLSPISTNEKKRAVLIGISYQGQPNSVKYWRSAYNVWLMNRFLVSFLGFPRESVVVLSEAITKVPTKENILGAFSWLMKDCQAGHSLVFFYSGRSLETQGIISDVDINAAIVKPLPRGAKLHAIIDTCHSGTFLGLPFMYKDQGNVWEAAQPPSTAYQGTSGGTAICFSTCDDPTASTSADVTGALTSSFIEAVKNERNLTYGRLLDSIRTKFRETQNRPNGSESSNTPSILQNQTNEEKTREGDERRERSNPTKTNEEHKDQNTAEETRFSEQRERDERRRKKNEGERRRLKPASTKMADGYCSAVLWCDVDIYSVFVHSVMLGCMMMTSRRRRCLDDE